MIMCKVVVPINEGGKILPKVSVVVPVYNAENYLNDCINSILMQTFENFELILVNDGSQDNSFNICTEYKKRDLRIKVISQANSGVSVARNVGKAQAQGEYVLFVDADDQMKPEMLEIMVKACEKNHADIAVCEVQNCQENEVGQAIDSKDVLTEMISSDEAMRLFLRGEMILSGPWNKLIKKNIISDIEYYVGKRMNEDKYFVFETLLKSSKIVYCKTKLYCYFVHQNSVTHNTFSDRWFDNIYFAKRIYKLILKERSFLEKEARYSMILTEYSLLRLMIKTSAYKEYIEEYKNLISEIREEKIFDILKWYKNSTRLGIMMVKVSIPLFKIVMKIK